MFTSIRLTIDKGRVVSSAHFDPLQHRLEFSTGVSRFCETDPGFRPVSAGGSAPSLRIWVATLRSMWIEIVSQPRATRPRWMSSTVIPSWLMHMSRPCCRSCAPPAMRSKPCVSRRNSAVVWVSASVMGGGYLQCSLIRLVTNTSS